MRVVNLTQDDDIGGTADICVVYGNGKMNLFSVTLYKDKIGKCMKNSSATKVYGLFKNENMEVLSKPRNTAQLRAFLAKNK